MAGVLTSHSHSLFLRIFIRKLIHPMSLQPILDDCGLTITRYEPLHGGDINLAYCLFGKEEKYFLKINEVSRYPAMFEKEADGLQSLLANSILKIPTVIKQGIVNNQQYLLLEWIDSGSIKSGFWEGFGAGLAQLHLKKQEFFGWKSNNYIGSLTQNNSIFPTWYLFYSECRIMPLVKQLFDKGVFSKGDLITAEMLCKKSEFLFPEEPPSLLHGDLWSGNFKVTAEGEAAIFDPAVYYGHREMDIGMTLLFGGFDQRFYEAYQEVYPMEKDWKQRLPLTQLYPLLVHALLFGGHYVESARKEIKN